MTKLEKKTLLYKGKNVAVFLQTDIHSGKKAIVKKLKINSSNSKALLRLNNEFEVLKKLNIEGVRNVIRLEKDETAYFLWLEFVEGITLAEFIEQPTLAPDRWLNIGISIVKIIAQIHWHKIIHGNIHPENIIIDPENNQVTIIGFGIAEQINLHSANHLNLDHLESNIAYISPEQTGRMNRVIDYRTDFYSFGVLFFKMLTGKLPYLGQDTISWVHAHIAKQPDFPTYLNSQFKAILSKLLAKNAENRYQSAFGLEEDLKRCLLDFQANGNIQTFTLGQNDVRSVFQITQKIYGRKIELALLLKAFEETQQKGTQIVMIEGYSGVGKSTLVKELYPKIIAKGGVIVKGKFDQFQKNIPYYALIQAFDNSISQLLTLTPRELKRWQNKITAVLGDIGKVLTDVIPNLELIIGPQKAIAELSGEEAQHRLNYAFSSLIKGIAQAESPLVLFIDDLQWVDAASLNLIQDILLNQEIDHLLFIGAYRNNEVEKGHLLDFFLKALNKKTANFQSIKLGNLDANVVHQLVRVSLNCSLEHCTSLSDLVYKKTQGNAFFVNQFLTELYQNNLITYQFPNTNKSKNKGKWIWDLETIRDLEYTDNVVHLLVQKIQKLPKETQNALKLAACIGNQFDLKTLALISEQPATLLINHLQIAIKEHLIQPKGNNYKFALFLSEKEVMQESNTEKALFFFVHDRIQQSAYSLIEVDEKKKVHLKIGRILLANISKDWENEKPKTIFDIVQHINKGIELVEGCSTKLELVKLNLIAAKKAKKSAAFTTAYNYLKEALTLIDSPENAWNENRKTTLTLYEELVATSYLTGNLEEMELYFEAVINNTSNVIEQIKVWEYKFFTLTAQKKLEEAIGIAVGLLNKLGVNCPRKVSKVRLLLGFIKIKWQLRNVSIQKLRTLPDSKDQSANAAAKIIASVGYPLLIKEPTLMALLAFRYIQLALKYGNSPETRIGYIGYALILYKITGNVNNSYRFGQLAMDLCKEPNAKTSMPFNILIRHHKVALRETLHGLDKTIQVALEAGDWESTAISMSVKTFHSFYCGRNLLETVEEGKAYLKTMTQMKSELITLRMRLYLQVLSNITNPNYEGKIFDGEFYEEAILFPQQVKFQDTSGVHSFYLFKAITYFLMGEYEMADKYLQKLRKNHEVFANLFHFPMHKFYDNLNSLYLFEAGKTVARKFIKKNVLQFEKWGKQTPMNHQHHAYLLKAAYHQMDKNFKDAQHYYDKAINAAKQNNFLGVEALASEMAGIFHLKYGFIHMAQLYLKNAYLLYQKWGASAKSNQILKKHPNFFNTTINLKIRDINKKSALNFQTNQQESLDLSSIIKASQTISGAIILSDLLKKMMDIIIENVGAQNGYLLLNRKQKWTIEAIGNIQTLNQQKQDSIILESTPLEKQREIFGQQLLSEAVIQFVGRTKKELVLRDATTDERFITDGFIRKKKIKSLLCFPVINKGQISGLLYLENNLVAGAFTSKRLKVLRLLSAQIAISIENAMLYQRLEKQNKELKLLNKELVTQNQDLQQFAYITSHNLREPASTILGLAKLFDKQNLANPINTQIIDNLEKSALNMNTIIKDLNYILSVKKDAEDARELIDLKVLTKNIKQSLSKQIQASGAIIAYDFSKLAPVYSLKGYWHSIFYNLISNAIKYRSEKRKPIITIQSETVKDLIIISFSDNGIGIDLEKYGENLFGMYKRFHVHREGKGLGLHLVKTQIEAMGGTIQVESQVEIGTTFKLLFSKTILS